ncbi:hypothetical protein BCR33DRAFT_552592 [Rhizoclosmatium globosum]|uniref:VOC domain-containing protein n=1 Tax=Rhizoclosmatium globosum TaxID=329046 RepID=A0A1Y2CSF6_9FUNG|nr:hypothetical protein BCR33DRAFT_552592 [Rhizoclosmatium globosum]|eukprot:ORY49794.1 hypothetical protein BCR33DRAFT_552592 [Rhizoclosmatium globosum]
MSLRVHHIEINSRSLADAFHSILAFSRTTWDSNLRSRMLQLQPLKENLERLIFVYARPGTDAAPFDRYAPGLNHLAFTLPTREAVDAVRMDLITGELKRLGGVELDENKYPYAGGPDYYAFTFLVVWTDSNLNL